MPHGVATAGQTPEEWANAVREAYALTGTEEQLLTSATDALAIARDKTARQETRLAAMRTYQSLVRQLDLQEQGVEDGETKTTATTGVVQWPRASIS